MAAIPFNAAMMQALAHSRAADGPTEEIFKDAKLLLFFFNFISFVGIKADLWEVQKSMVRLWIQLQSQLQFSLVRFAQF